ncbi:hypothetical protein AALP_AAs70168U000100, partial [Arabis alpina]
SFTAVCRLVHVCNMLESLTPLCDASIGPIGGYIFAFVRCFTAICRFRSDCPVTGTEFPFMECSILPHSSLAFSGMVIGSFVSKSSPQNPIQNATISTVDAAWINAVPLECGTGWICSNQRRITLVQGTATQRSHSTLVAVALASKAAINAASISRIRKLNVSSDSRTLVTLCNSGKVINELKSFLFDICCMLGSFSFSIRSMYGPCIAKVAVCILAKYARLSLNSAWM